MKHPYLIHQCANPTVIRNRYTGEQVYVQCGRCDYCRLRKSSQAEMECNIQLASSAYCDFLTLTYSNDYIPILRPVFEGDGTLRGFYSCPRTDVSYDVLVNGGRRKTSVSDSDRFFVPANGMTYSQYTELAAKTHLEYYKNPQTGRIFYNSPHLKGAIPYAERLDMVNFKKRLRYYFVKFLNLSKDELKKIHIYEVSEYGPQTFRPHFHLLLFYDSPKIRHYGRRCYLSAWRFGNISSEHCATSCSSYVAGYANSFVSLPHFYQHCKQIRPYSRKSNRFAQSLFKQSVEDAKQSGDDTVFVDGVWCTINGEPLQCRLPRSYNARLFPFLDGRSVATADSNARLACEIRKLSQVFARTGELKELDPAVSPMQAAIAFRGLVESYWNQCQPLPAGIGLIASTVRLFDNRVDFWYGVDSLYRLFVKYRNLVDEWVNPAYPRGCIPYGEFYRIYRRLYAIRCKQSQKRLSNFYQSLVDCSNDPSRLITDYRYFYPLSWNLEEMEDWYKNSAVQRMVNDANRSMALDRVKHKALNDANNGLIVLLDKN